MLNCGQLTMFIDLFIYFNENRQSNKSINNPYLPSAPYLVPGKIDCDIEVHLVALYFIVLQPVTTAMANVSAKSHPLYFMTLLHYSYIYNITLLLLHKHIQNHG